MNDFSQQKQEYSQLIQQVLDEAKHQGATAAEAAVGIETGLSASVRLGDVETLEYNHDKGLSVTVFVGQSKGSASTSDFSRQAIVDTVRAACSIARYTAADEFAGLADKALMAWDYPDLDLYHPWQVSSEQAIDLALECEATARDFDKRIINSEGATVSSHSAFRVYGNSHGFIGGYPTSRHSLSCSVIGEDNKGMERDYWYTMARNAADMESAANVGRITAERTIARLNPRSLSTRQVPVVFSAEMATGFFGHFISAIRGGSLYRRTSFLLDSKGKQIFPSWLQLAEQPLLKGAIGSAPYDGDGVRTQERDLVIDGVLQGYVLDAYAARRLGMQTTANAGGVHNLSVHTSDFGRDELLRRMGTGLLVTELMGQGVNNVTGDYSRGAAGFWVENGEIQYPVSEITIASNVKQMMLGIQAIANDINPHRNIRTGSILIDKMTVAGA
ncbi:MAG: metalloprotease PmbA [Gammaproteobacteria bacterium]|nr:metalloprotease PmbA [Gammaproteobacteria bacterium]